MDDLISIGKRLKEYLENRKMKVNELGKLSNTSGTQIYNIVKGKKYGVDKFLSVIRQLPDLNVYWLISGEGNMYKENPTSTLDIKGQPEESLLLKKEVENLKALLAYQEMTLNAYKRSLDMAAASNEDLKKLVEFYRDQLEYKQNSKNIQSA